MKVPIVRGPLRGRRWDPRSGGKLLRVLGGTYEPEQTQLFQALLRPGDIVFDVGAHVGYYTLLASTLVGPAGQVHAFEPAPRNAGFLRRHVSINRLENVRTEQAAVAAENGTAHFDFGTGSGTGHIAAAGALQVRTVRLDDYCAEHHLEPHTLKIDVEGAEVEALRGAHELLASVRPRLFLSTHGPTVHRECLDLLSALGYRLTPILGTDVGTTAELLAEPA